MIRGCDVSSYQPKLDGQKMREAGCDFLIVKVTDGNRGQNKLAKQQVKIGLDAGMLVMLYHYAWPNGANQKDWLADAVDEAIRLDRIADEIEQAYSRPIFTWLDLERNEALNKMERLEWRNWANRFRQWLREEGERPTGFYSGQYFTQDLWLPDDWSSTAFWMARYPNVWRPDGLYTYADMNDKSRPPNTPYWPKAPSPFPRADIWQDGGDANKAWFPGVGNDGEKYPCDTNLFAGSIEELRELIQAAA